MAFTNIPQSHIVEAQKVLAQPYIDLYEISLRTGGVIRLSAWRDVSWMGYTFEGAPLQFSGDGDAVDDTRYRPSFHIYQGDNGQFNPYLATGVVDGALLSRFRVLKEDVEENANVYQLRKWTLEVKSYTKSLIRFECRRLSDGVRSVLPARTFSTPEFPTVRLF